MKILGLINLVRKELIATIANAVKSKGCIGTFYKNVGQHHSIDQTEEEYSNSPVVVIHNKEYNAYGGYEAATVFDLFLDEGCPICTLNGEAGEDWDEPLENVQVEGLMCIVAWLHENNFIKLESKISDEIINKILVNEEQSELFSDIFFDEMESDDEPNHKKIRQLLRAYRNNDCDNMLTALCGWSLETLISKLTERTKV